MGEMEVMLVWVGTVGMEAQVVKPMDFAFRVMMHHPTLRVIISLMWLQEMEGQEVEGVMVGTVVLVAMVPQEMTPFHRATGAQEETGRMGEMVGSVVMEHWLLVCF
jgi:hypothetical protein